MFIASSLQQFDGEVCSSLCVSIFFMNLYTTSDRNIPCAEHLWSRDQHAFICSHSKSSYGHTSQFFLSFCQAFYAPAKDRPNFSVLVTAPVNKVLSKTDTNGQLTATGVEFEYEGKPYVVHAKKEVILSAGSAYLSHVFMYDSLILALICTAPCVLLRSWSCQELATKVS